MGYGYGYGYGLGHRGYYGGYYGLGHRGYYGYGHHYGKRSADAEPEAVAAPEAAPEAEADAAAHYYGGYYGRGYGYGYGRIRIWWTLQPWILRPWIRIRSRIRILWLNFCLNYNFLSHISSPIIELSINQQTTAPPPYINPAKKEKNIWINRKNFIFKKNIWSVLFQLWYPTI